MDIRILVNGLATAVGGGGTVWRALVQGARSSNVARFLLVTGSDQVASLVTQGSTSADAVIVAREHGTWRGEPLAIRKFARKWQADVVITQNRTSIVGLPQIALHVNLLRFLPPEPGAHWKDIVRDLLARRSLRGADANVFESHYLLEAARARFPRTPITRPSVAYVGLDPGWIVDAEVPVRTPKERGPHLLAVTMPNPHKDNEVLADLLAELGAQSNIKWHLTVAGGRVQDAFSTLRERASLRGVTDQIEYAGFLSRDDLAARIDQSFALVNPSRVESFAMVPLESMARGTPVVATNAASMPESLGSAGLLVSAGDARAMAEEVGALWAAPDRWDVVSQNGRRWAARLTWEAFARHILSVAETLTQPSAR